MKYYLKIVWLVPILVVLMACSSDPAAESETAVVGEAEPTQIVENDEPEEPTEEPAPTATDEVVAETEEEADPAPAAVDGPAYEPATTVLQALDERPSDQAKGADEPLLTIIEYGDFQ